MRNQTLILAALLTIGWSAPKAYALPVQQPQTTEIGITLPKVTYIQPISAPQIEPLAQLPTIASESAAAPTPVASSSYSGSLSDWLLKLRTCESGGNYAINTGNGFFGAYQFSQSTWSSMGTAYNRADLAPPSVQDAAIIANTNRSSGGLATQNPGCYAKEGLSAFPPQ